MNFQRPEQGVSPVLGVILLVAVTVILSATIGVFVLDLGDNVQENAQAGVTFDQSDTVGTGGDYTVTTRLVSADNVDSIAVKSDVVAPEGTVGLTEDFDDGSVMYRRNGNGDIEWAEKVNDGRMRYYLDAPANSGSVDVTVHFEGNSYEGSGAAVYAVDADGNQIMDDAVCDAEGGGGSKPADFSDIGFTCTNDQGSFTWDGTYTFSSSVEIDRIYIVTDLENVHYEYWDRAILHDLSVAGDSETVQACVECALTTSSTNTADAGGDPQFANNNDITDVGEEVTVRAAEAGDEITVVGILDGKPAVLQTYTVEDR